MDWLCGYAPNATSGPGPGLAGSEIQDCHIELAIWICHLLFSVVCSSILILFHYCLIRTKPWTFRYREHNSRWVAALGLHLLLVCQAGEAWASELPLEPHRFAFLLSPLLALAAALLSGFFYNVVETYQLGAYLLLPATYWFFTGLLHVVKLVHLYEAGLDGQHLRVCLTWAAVLVYMLLFAIKASILITKCPACTPAESVEHEDLSNASYRHPSSNLPSKCVFWWMNSLLRLGCKRPLELSDLGRLPGDESAEMHLDVFTEVYHSEKEKLALQNGGCPSLWRCYWLSSWPMLSLAAVFRLLADLVSFLGPLSISVIVSYAANEPQEASPPTPNEPQYLTVWEFLQNGYVMATLVLVASLAQSAFSQAFTHLVIVEGIHVRTALQTFIFKKSLRLPAWVTGSEGRDAGSIVNYVSSDAYNILMLFIMGHYVWAVPLKIAALLALLYRQLGYSALLGAASMLLLVPLQYFVGSHLSKVQKGLMGSADGKLKKINELLQGIRQLKLYAWEFILGAGVTRARDQELKFLLKHQVLININAFLTDTSTVIVSLVTFAVYPTIEGKPVAATDVFSGLALFSQLAVPLILFPITVPIVISAMVSTERLSRFLEAGEQCPEDAFPDGLVRRGSSTMLMVSKTGSMYLSVRQDEPESSENEESILRPNLQEAREQSDAEAMLDAEKASLAWREDAVLRDVSLTVAAGQLTVVVGGVGSGKSSLLLGLLGEMRLLSGNISWNCDDSPVAYVPQKPWLLNATIRENILFGKKYLPNWYDSVTAACSLKPDLEILPDGDQTEIGEKGVTLSGGQRQRIALARALYCKAKILILDDPTSALDAHVGLHVFENAILHAVHRRRHAVVLVTSRIQFLSKAQQVVVLDGGRVKHRGTFEHIVKMDPALRDAWMDSIRREETEFEKGAGVAVLKERRKLRRMVTMQAIGVGSSTLGKSRKFARGISLTRQMSFDGMAPLPYHECGEEECALPDLPEAVAVHVPVVRSTSESATAPTTNHRTFQRLLSTATYSSEVPSEAPLGDDVGGKLLVGEDRERGTIKKQLYLKYMQCCGWPFCMLFLAFSLLAQTVSVWRDFWLSHWSEAANVVNATTEDQDSIMHHYLIGYSALSVSGIVLAFSRGLMGLYAGYRALRNLHREMLDSVVRSPIRFFDVTPVGRILNRFSSDMAVIDRKLQITIQTLVHFILLCLSAIAVNAIITPYFLVITVPVVIIYYFIQHFFRFSSRELQRLDSLTKSPIMSLVSETLGGLTTIRAFREEKRFINRMLQAVDKNNGAFLMMNCANRWLGITLDFLGSAVVFLATVLAILAARSNHVSPAFVGLAVSYTLLVPIYLNWVVRHLADLEMYMSAVERVDQYSHLPPEPYNEGKALPPSWPHSGAISFQGASMRYDPTLEPAILKLTLTIRPGEKVGVCGRTGSGKSTLALGLFRMVDTFEGTVSIDGIPIHSVKLLEARSKLSVVPQDAVLFSGTLRWNLDPNQVHSDEKIWEALELAQMKETVMNLPAKLANEVVAGGENFSAGQKQLICLARAILRRSKILVMDEATATLDGGMDHVLQEVIAKACSGRTIITIAHHISTIMKCDTVIVMDQGQILECGPPGELLAQPRSAFAALAHSSLGN